jgi:Na+/H+-dicarboxylate symporter
MKKTTYFNLATLIALLLGILAGSFSSTYIHELSLSISEIFLKMLKFISLPMIFLAIVSTMTQMKSLSEARFMLRKILKYTIATTLVAATIGLLLFLLVRPNPLASEATTTSLQPQGSYLSFLSKIIPSSLIEPFIENNVLGMAFIAMVFSISILKLPEKTTQTVKDFFQGLFQALLKATSWLITIMPIGIFAFTVQFTENIRSHQEDLKKLLLYGLVVIAANLVQGFIILPLLLKWKKISPIQIARGMMPALATAFFTKSSNASLPLALECSKNRLKLSDKTAQFSFPLCSIINMNGCAAFILITILFVCTGQGITFSPFELIGWVFLATLAAIGNAGVPMGCYFLTTAFLIGMGVPIEMMGIILPLYSLFDMVETALNVWSDSCVTVVVDQELKQRSLGKERHPVRA